MSVSNTYEHLLSEVGIRITAVRLLVLRVIREKMHGGAFSLQDVLHEIPTADNSSVFRSLTLFAEKGLLHTIDDGTGMQKYCLCTCTDSGHHHRHVHFTCIRCQRTLCLEEVPIPHITLPEGFVAEDTELVVKGICPKCSLKTI